MTISARYLTGCAALALAAVVVAPPPALAIDPARLQAAEQTPNDWLTYHGGYKSQHYSGLDQINANNVKNLEVAWTHLPGRSTRGLQSMPLAADGVLYYSGSYSRVYALDGATGKLIWSYSPSSTMSSWRCRRTRRTIAALRLAITRSSSARSTGASSRST